MSANFWLFGNFPFLIDELKSIKILGARMSKFAFKIFAGIDSMGEAFDSFRLVISLITDNRSTG